jgi:hypothetical protein
METTRDNQPRPATVTVLYTHNGEQRTRCFHVVDGELVPAQCRKSRIGAANGTSRGIGTLIESGTKAVGIKPCGGCLKRKEALNAITPSWVSRILGKLGKM